MNKAVFLDRDGVINVEKNYLYKVEDFEFIEGSIEAIRLLNEAGYKVIVITNQAGVARGYYKVEDVERLHQWINNKLYKYGAKIDGFYFCPHHPEGKILDYAIKCECRKPGTKLLEEAIRDFDINIRESFFVGDKNSDMLSGKKMGLKTYLVLTGYGQGESKNNADYVTVNLYSSILNILSSEIF